MDKDNILNSIKNNGGAEIPALQEQFSLSYREAKKIIDELIADKRLSFESGLKYVYVKDADKNISAREEEKRDYYKTAEERRIEILKRLSRFNEYHNNEEDDDDNDSDDDDEEDDDDDSDDDDDDYGLISSYYDKINSEKQQVDLHDDIKKAKVNLGNLYTVNVDFKDSADNKNILISDLKPQTEEEKSKIPILQKANIKTRKYAIAIPSHSLWCDENKFYLYVSERIERIVKSDKSMTLSGALKKAEISYEAVRDTVDLKMAQVYDRIVYEFKILGQLDYLKLRNFLNES